MVMRCLRKEGCIWMSSRHAVNRINDAKAGFSVVEEANQEMLYIQFLGLRQEGLHLT